MKIFQMAGMVLVDRDRLNRLVRNSIPLGPRSLRWRVEIISGPRALEGLHFLIASSVCVGVNCLALLSLCFFSCLVVFLAVFAPLCWITDENCLLNPLAILFGSFMYLLLNLIAWDLIFGLHLNI